MTRTDWQAMWHLVRWAKRYTALPARGLIWEARVARSVLIERRRENSAGYRTRSVLAGESTPSQWITAGEVRP